MNASETEKIRPTVEIEPVISHYNARLQCPCGWFCGASRQTDGAASDAVWGSFSDHLREVHDDVLVP